MPTFSGSGAPAEPISSYDSENMMQAIYDEDMDNGGTSFWIDRMLQQTGVNPDTNDLFSRGKMLYLSDITRVRSVFRRREIRIHSQRLLWYIYRFAVGLFAFRNRRFEGERPELLVLCIYRFLAQRHRKKIITDNNVAVTLLYITNNSSSSKA
jgi:hypothetical protein